MQRVDGFYLYSVGHQIHPLADLRYQDSGVGRASTYDEARWPVYIAESAVETLVSRSVFRLRTSYQPGQLLLTAIRTLKAKIEAEPDGTKTLSWYDTYSVSSALTAFEAVLGAELSLSPLYVVTQKAGFDTAVLIETGAACFPAEIWVKAPEAIADLQQATKCIAFEVFTAAGFHLHRANEAVLRRYWDALTNNAPRPASRNMGDYLSAMGQRNVGDDKVKMAIRNLKDFHRNPLIHPEHTIETADQAIALMNGVHTVIVQMLLEIPQMAPVPSIPAGAVAPAMIATEQKAEEANPAPKNPAA